MLSITLSIIFFIDIYYIFSDHNDIKFLGNAKKRGK